MLVFQATLPKALAQPILEAFIFKWNISFFSFGIRRWWDGEFPLSGTSVGVDPTPDDLAVRVLRNPVVGSPCSSVALGPGRRSANALRTDTECLSDPGQRGNNASCWNILQTACREPAVAGCDIEHAVAISSRSSAAATV
jgi:hypothetical protein